MLRERLFAWLFISVTIMPGNLFAAPSGLDSRPVNATCLAFDRPDENASVDLQRVFPSLLINNDVVVLTQPPGDASYWYFAARNGVIRRFANTPNVSSWDTVLDLSASSGSGKVALPADGGFVQLVFHPDYPSDPRVFVNYSTASSYDEPNDIIVSSFEMSPGGAEINESSEVILITQPRGEFHQGGFMAFGPDGFLYFGLGDGAPQTDPDNNAQNLLDFRGKILRIDVDNIPSGEVYGIPADNPHAGNPYCNSTGNLLPCPEIFSSGFRNPFRGDIDHIAGDIWVGDVGYTTREEVNKVIKGGNYGWNVYEGMLCREFSGSCANTSLIGPVIEYSHVDGQCAVIGGYVYRGNTLLQLQGRYLFADYCTSKISAIQYDADGKPFEEILLPGGTGIGQIRTFAKDTNGELYVVTGSEIFKIIGIGGGGSSFVPATLSQTGCFEAADPTIPAHGLIPYDLNSALWSDGATKRRWMALPEGATVDIDADGDFLFPPGTVLIKEFAYDGVPHETRLLVHHLDGVWAGYSYEWRADGLDADLLPAGLVKDLSSGHTWTYPSRAECLRCHTDVANFSLGPEVAQLNREMLYPQTMRIANELETLDQIGVFTAGLPAVVGDLPSYAELNQMHYPVDYRARSYLHSNCSGCHRPGEITQAPMDFRFSTPITDINACDVTPLFGDLGVTGAKIISPGYPGLSVTGIRDGSRDPLIQMPPLATAIVHDEWITLLDSWISDTTVCDPDVDSDLDGVPDKLDNCPASSNTSQFDTDRNGTGDACELTANAGVDQFLSDLDGNGTEQVSLDGSRSAAPVPSDPITAWTWRKNDEVIAIGETALITLPTGVHTIQLEIGADQGRTDTDETIITVQEPVPLSVNINDIKVSEGAEKATFTVSLSSPSMQVVTVDVVTAGGSAVSPDDYVAVALTTLTFNPGETIKLLGVNLVDDALIEEDEAFTVTLSNAVNAPLGKAVGTATIIDNDSAPNVSINDVVVFENDAGGVAGFTVSLSKPSPQEVTVGVLTADGSAVSPDDYIAVTGTTLIFNPGETSQMLNVTLVDDLYMEGYESFSISLGNTVNAVLGDARGTGTIIDNDVSACGQPNINAGVDRAVFVWRDCISGVWYARFTAGGQYTVYRGAVDSDQEFSSVMIFDLESNDVVDSITDPGQIDYFLHVANVYQDGLDFSYPAGATVCFGVDQPAGATVLVGASRTPVPVPFDLETLGPCGVLTRPSVSIDDVTVGEDAADGVASFTVSLSSPLAQVVTVQVATADGEALAGSDYTALPPTTLTFNPGETSQVLAVSLVDDTEPEDAETFTVGLSAPVNAVLGSASGTGTIIDDDAIPVDIPGDITGDGVVNVADVLVCTRIMLGLASSANEDICDVAPLDAQGYPQGDDQISAGDISLLQQMALGMR